METRAALKFGRKAARDQLFFPFFFFDSNRLEILSFEDLAAIQAFHIVDAVTPCDDLGAVVLASGLHKSNMGFILMIVMALSRGVMDRFGGISACPVSKTTGFLARRVKILTDAVPYPAYAQVARDGASAAARARNAA
jgi:hypothetical protein